jgi:hypothetical protein
MLVTEIDVLSDISQRGTTINNRNIDDRVRFAVTTKNVGFRKFPPQVSKAVTIEGLPAYLNLRVAGDIQWSEIDHKVGHRRSELESEITEST